MVKQSNSKSQIVLREKHTSLDRPKSEEEIRREVICDYLDKYALIANRAMTPTLYDIYMEALKRQDLRKIRKGLASYLREGSKWPWPADLIEAIEEEV